MLASAVLVCLIQDREYTKIQMARTPEVRGTSREWGTHVETDYPNGRLWVISFLGLVSNLRR